MDSFWDFVWLLVWSFVFVAYLMVFFNILTDLFRDRSMGGFAKAIWILALIFVPFLSALIYLIARGHGMGQRQQAAVHRAQADTDAYIRSTAGGSPAKDIAQAKELLDDGTITSAEFEQIKVKALA